MSKINSAKVTIDKVFDNPCTDECKHKCILNVEGTLVTKYLSGQEIYEINNKNGHKNPEHISNNSKQ